MLRKTVKAICEDQNISITLLLLRHVGGSVVEWATTYMCYRAGGAGLSPSLSPICLCGFLISLPRFLSVCTVNKAVVTKKNYYHY